MHHALSVLIGFFSITLCGGEKKKAFNACLIKNIKGGGERERERGRRCWGGGGGALSQAVLCDTKHVIARR